MPEILLTVPAGRPLGQLIDPGMARVIGVVRVIGVARMPIRRYALS
ncbi:MULTISPECIES: hypothetical protein [unclassified Frankia]|nr:MULTISPECIES: hypothetical protein [unclassified Frankia]